MKVTTRRMTGAAVTVALTAVAAQISIPLPFLVPVTLQVPVVLAAGLILGPYTAAVSMAVYILMGLLGLPVFANFGGGAAYVFKPGFGFLAGFIPAAWLAGFLSRNGERAQAAQGAGKTDNASLGPALRGEKLLRVCRSYMKLGVPVLALYAVGLPYQFMALCLYNGFTAPNALSAVSASLGVFLSADALKIIPLTLMRGQLVSLRKFTARRA